MKEMQQSQVIIVNRNPADSSIQIIIPPFRPINLFEIEDNFEGITQEIETKVSDNQISEQIIHFVTAFKDSMEEEDILPIVEYFLIRDVEAMNPEEIKMIFDAVKEFIEYIKDDNRLMH
ncbi:hypothetical protein H9L01_06880 [Erysipelothrix inopinata]|uniref:Uncharacterized protein n=1 Tax=Erysipelothrix inopinata TaxID=225084 RepID=A0A7G9RWW9_9FIRM|nr:hypothetical protein [Erysipelothrix inopinata]QNN60094.1 hypothetical protein H9L01_06880 [Erysipelothrix inopinata]